MNQAWHQRHKMPANATPEQRLAWHLKHQKHCGCRRIPKTLQPLLADRPAAMILQPQVHLQPQVRKSRTRKTLRSRGQYWYGEGPSDVWNLFVQIGGLRSDMPANHWKQAFCYKCGRTQFEVEFQYGEDPDDPDDPPEPAVAVRECVQCQECYDVLDPTGFENLSYYRSAVCICGGRVFEVVGVTEPSGKHNPESAWWFHLALRCVDCGCLGAYATWTERYNDWRELFTHF